MSHTENSAPVSDAGKTVLVLGAKSDIAQAVAHEFARHGFRIILAARNAAGEAMAAIKSDLEIRRGVKAYAVEFDAEKFDTHAAVYANLPAKPDVVFCAFGYLGEQLEAEKNWSEAARIINVNFTGAVSILNLAAEDFETRGAGDIIGVSSVAGERGRRSNYFYGSAKSGFSTYLDGLRHRLAASNVNVLSVKPGFVETKMTAAIPTPKPLTAQPDQLAKAIYAAFRQRKSTIYYLPVWRFIMFVIRNIPEFIFKKTKL